MAPSLEKAPCTFIQYTVVCFTMWHPLYKRARLSYFWSLCSRLYKRNPSTCIFVTMWPLLFKRAPRTCTTYMAQCGRPLQKSSLYLYVWHDGVAPHTQESSLYSIEYTCMFSSEWSPLNKRAPSTCTSMFGTE
jgi:hypothetical protein